MIVIPMAGRSQRFYDAGYAVPKFMLDLNGKSVFAHAVESFRGLFDQTAFLFVLPPGEEAAAFVRAECQALGLKDVALVTLDRPTAGQAETVELGLASVAAPDTSPLTIFNIDTFRPGFTLPGGLASADGWLEVFRGTGANWSYVRPGPGPEPLVVETAEKRPISDLCCTGLYHFARADRFRQALAAERAAPQAAELYVAPIYNHLIGSGAQISYRLIERQEVIFCGTPAEYEDLQTRTHKGV
ncbi:NTP transferase domain-containing protein [Phenylobacterium sp.]|uniref:NTP transferase domain-containing protein n=1 Tax=Phenylobacterium sp. TaxID=1871053 RepID=UPI002731A9BA|nr:NTP transferase domain-containing protein [Phenylobacterium sp.]MDP2215602.1 NTP transferase domain-containing protein [Phenylobacterium sp.]